MSYEIGTATDVGDLLSKLNAFLTVGHALEPAYSGVGDGTLEGLMGKAGSVVETITVAFSDAANFTATGSITGALGAGTVGALFDSTKCKFTATAGVTPWQNGDTVVFTMTPAWTQKRAANVGTGTAEYIWMAPGNDGAAEIYVGALRFTAAGGDYDNLRLGGFSGFDAGMSFTAQPGAMTRPVLPLLRVGNIPYWIVASGRRVALVAKASTVYESCYLGLFDTYANPTQHPYPLIVGGSMSWGAEPAVGSSNWRWSYTGNEHRAFPFGAAAGIGAAGANDNASTLRMRRPDGVYRGFAALNLYASASGFIWPYGGSMTNLVKNLDGSVALFAVVLQEDLGETGGGGYPSADFTFLSPQSWGELEGISGVSGDGNSAENTVTVGRTKHLVVQNVYRTTKASYFALRLA